MVEVEGALAGAVGAFQRQGEGRWEGVGAAKGRLGERLAISRRQHELQRRVGHAAGECVGAVDGRDHNHAELRVGKEGELGGKPVDRAAVAEPALAEALLHGEAQPISGSGAGLRELGGPHGFERLGGEEAIPALEHHSHEAREVQDGRVHAAGRGHAEFEAGRVEIRPVEPPHEGVGEIVDDPRFGRKRAARHPQRLNDCALHVVRERLALRHLQSVSHHRDPRVRVLGAGLRFVDQRSPVQAGDRGREIGAGVVEIVPRRWFPDEPRPMRHQLPQRDRRAGTVVRREVGQIAAHGRVNVDLVPLGQLHDRDVGEELGYRSDPVHGFGGGGNPRRLLAESVRPDDSAGVDQRNRHRREPLLLPLALDHLRQLIRHFGEAGARRRLLDRVCPVVPAAHHGEARKEEECDANGRSGPGAATTHAHSLGHRRPAPPSRSRTSSQGCNKNFTECHVVFTCMWSVWPSPKRCSRRPSVSASARSIRPCTECSPAGGMRPGDQYTGPPRSRRQAAFPAWRVP